MLKLYKKFTGLILASAFVTVMLFGLNMGMDMRQDGTMSGCAFDQSVTYPMNYEEHINHWQQTFTALNWQRYAQEAHYIPQAVRSQREITAKLSDHILQALSKGRLNPRLYNFSHTTA